MERTQNWAHFSFICNFIEISPQCVFVHRIPFTFYSHIRVLVKLTHFKSTHSRKKHANGWVWKMWNQLLHNYKSNTNLHYVCSNDPFIRNVFLTCGGLLPPMDLQLGAKTLDTQSITVKNSYYTYIVLSD